MKKILFRTNGGLGKQIMATAVAKQIRQQYPDATIHVQTSYADPFYNLGFVDKYYPMNPVPYFYEEHKDFEVLETEAYLDLGFRSGEKHLVEAWCERLGLDVPKTNQGTLILDEEERNYARQNLIQMKLDRPLIAIQISGGTSYYEPMKAQDPFKTKHYRDYQFESAQELVNSIIKSGMGAVIQIGLPTEPKLQNCFHLPDNQIIGPRQLFSLLDMCNYGIFIDSFCQHAWAALGKEKGIVLWGGTNPATLGYASNINLINKNSCKTLHCNRPNTFMNDFVGNGSFWKCPNAECMNFKSERIVGTLQGLIDAELKAQKPESEMQLVEDAEVVK